MGHSIARSIEMTVDLEAGTIHTFVPADLPAVEVQAHNLEHGILTRPVSAYHRIAHDDGSSSFLAPKPNMDDALAEIMREYLLSDPKALCIFEDPNRTEVHATYLTSQGFRVGLYGSEVYFVIMSEDASEPDFLRASFREPRAWLFIGVFTRLPEGVSWPRGEVSPLQMTHLDNLVAETQKIVVGAYDNDGFVVWERA